MRGIRWLALTDKKDAEEQLIAQLPDDAGSKALNSLWQTFVAMLDGAAEATNANGFIDRAMITMGEADLNLLRAQLGKCRRDVDLALSGATSDDAIARALDRIAEVNERIGIYRKLIDLLIMEQAKTSATHAGSVSLVDGYVLYRRAREPRALGSATKRLAIPTLFLDADLDAEVVRRWWPNLADSDVVDVTCGWSPHVKVIQIKGQTFSKSRLLGWRETNSIESKRIAGRQAALDTFIRHCMDLNGAAADEVMIVSYKDLIDALAAKSDDGLYTAPAHPTASRAVGWFNAIAGIDRWKGVKVGFVVGRPQPMLDAFSEMARAIWGHEDRDWVEVEADEAGMLKAPYKRFRLHTRDDAVAATVWATSLPDERQDRIYRLVTWGQPMQADGRVRPVYRTEDSPCVLFILGEVPRGMAVDAVVHWDDAVPDRFDQVTARVMRGGGVVPSSAGALAKFAPDIWKDAKAVERDCRLQADDDEVSEGLEDRLARAVQKAELFALPGLFAKPPLGAKDKPYSTKGGLFVVPGASAEDEALEAAVGSARVEKQPGSASRWMRTPAPAGLSLSAGLAATFGPKLTKVSLGDDDAMTIATLNNKERDAAEARAEQIYDTLDTGLSEGRLTRAERTAILFQEIGELIGIVYADTPDDEPDETA